MHLNNGKKNHKRNQQKVFLELLMFDVQTENLKWKKAALNETEWEFK